MITSVISATVALVCLLITRQITNEISGHGEAAIPVVLILAGTSALLSLLIVFFNSFISSCVSARNMEKVRTGMRDELYERASAVEQRCYDDTEFYDKFSMAIGQSDWRATEVLNTCTNFFVSFMEAGSLIALVGALQPVIRLFVLLNVGTSFAINMWQAKVRHRFTMERIPLEREQSYISRIFYFRNHSQELRLFSRMQGVFENHFRNPTLLLSFLRCSGVHTHTTDRQMTQMKFGLPTIPVCAFAGMWIVAVASVSCVYNDSLDIEACCTAIG